MLLEEVISEPLILHMSIKTYLPYMLIAHIGGLYSLKSVICRGDLFPVTPEQVTYILPML